MNVPYTERDLSWLSFNFRVLQEAQDLSVPLYERIKFLAIYSSNLDEFFRVRVATMRSFKQLRKKTRQKLQVKPKKILAAIQEEVDRQQRLFGSIFREEILPALEEAGIDLLRVDQLSSTQMEWSSTYFEQEVARHIQLFPLAPDMPVPFLKNKTLYLVVAQEVEEAPFVLLEIPTEACPRFIQLPAEHDRHAIIFLDDLIRLQLDKLLSDPHGPAFAIKLSRDAELYIGDEMAGNLVEKIKQSLQERDIGTPTRFLFDSEMPTEVLQFLRDHLQLHKQDLIYGGRYHNFNDLFSFPDPTQHPALHDPPRLPLPHPILRPQENLLDIIREGDQLLHFPYQQYDPVSQLLWQAAEAPDVTHIKITLYRVADNSSIARGLLKALERGKQVVVFVEVKARFDEASNLFWGQELKKAGAQVLYSIPNIKVHTKLMLIQSYQQADIAYLGTGNFNEKTARLYGDHALLTARQDITHDVEQVFALLEGRILYPQCQKVQVAPFQLRNFFVSAIDREIALARQGLPARIIAKMNSLEDRDMIQKLYEASQAGVQIQLIIRGICCLQAGVAEWSENIEVISIVDRFLEHARIYWFQNNGEEELYLASADWMTRNLDRRVEVAFPIEDPQLKATLKHILNLQLGDNTKARWLDPARENQYKNTPEHPKVRAQEAIYQFLTPILNPNLGPQLWTPILNPNLEPQSWTPILNPNFEPQLWTPNLNPNLEPQS
jgi:polyphosphate kinase